MRRVVSGIGLIALCFFACVPAHAFDAGDLAACVQEQQHALHQNLLDGKLSLAEADIIAYNLNRIVARQSLLQANGTLSDRELQRLKTLLDHNSAMLAKQRFSGVKKLF